MLHAQGITNVHIDVHGDHSGQPEPFRKDFEAKLAKAPPNFNFRGPYENHRVDALMRSVHAVLVPSVWWENSPLVIQEALLNRRPVICSDIGGMAEKVATGRTASTSRAAARIRLPTCCAAWRRIRGACWHCNRPWRCRRPSSSPVPPSSTSTTRRCACRMPMQGKLPHDDPRIHRRPQPARPLRLGG